MSDWNGIKATVEENGNVCTVSMLELREAAGKEKLGVNVNAGIKKKLAGLGLGHIPADLPRYQHEQIRLYKKGTAVGELIDTVIMPGQQNDKKLAEQVNEEQADYLEIIEQIRNLVGE